MLFLLSCNTFVFFGLHKVNLPFNKGTPFGFSLVERWDVVLHIGMRVVLGSPLCIHFLSSYHIGIQDLPNEARVSTFELSFMPRPWSLEPIFFKNLKFIPMVCNAKLARGLLVTWTECKWWRKEVLTMIPFVSKTYINTHLIIIINNQRSHV